MEQFLNFLNILSSVIIVLFAARFVYKTVKLAILDYRADRKLGKLMRSGNYELRRSAPIPSMLPYLENTPQQTSPKPSKNNEPNSNMTKTDSNGLKTSDSDFIVEMRFTEQELGFDLIDDPSKFIDRYDIEGFIALCKTQPYSTLSKIKQRLLEEEEYEACDDLDVLIEEKIKNEN